MMHAPLTNPHPQHRSHRSHGYKRLGIHRRHYERTSTTPSKPTSNGGRSRTLWKYRHQIFNGDRDKSDYSWTSL